MTSREATPSLPWIDCPLRRMPFGWLAVIGLLYAAAFALPVVVADGPDDFDSPRVYLFPFAVSLFQFWLTDGIGPDGIGALWAAHPALWCGLVLLAARQWLAAGLAGVVATILTMYSVALFLGFNIGGHHASIGFGYGAWLLSAALLAVAGLSRFMGRLVPRPAATYLQAPLWGALGMLTCLLVSLGMIPVPYSQLQGCTLRRSLF